MITVRLLGGLGNQLFQRAYGMALEARGYEVGYDRSLLGPNKHRDYMLGEFKNLELVNPSGPEFVEKSHAFDIQNLYPPDPSLVIGYWQTEKYFIKIKDKIREEFKLPNSALSSVSTELINKMGAANTVAIHVRRGDYVHLQHYHGLLPNEYYYHAVSYIEEQTKAWPVVKPYIFSDDPKWCRENMSGFQHEEIISTGNPHVDMYLMSLCGHAVLSNSSFGWWGAWLGDQKVGRIVVTPKRWFVTDEVDTRDLIPDRWVKL